MLCQHAVVDEKSKCQIVSNNKTTKQITMKTKTHSHTHQALVSFLLPSKKWMNKHINFLTNFPSSCKVLYGWIYMSIHATKNTIWLPFVLRLMYLDQTKNKTTWQLIHFIFSSHINSYFFQHKGHKNIESQSKLQFLSSTFCHISFLFTSSCLKHTSTHIWTWLLRDYTSFTMTHF